MNKVEAEEHILMFVCNKIRTNYKGIILPKQRAVASIINGWERVKNAGAMAEAVKIVGGEQEAFKMINEMAEAIFRDKAELSKVKKGAFPGSPEDMINLIRQD